MWRKKNKPKPVKERKERGPSALNRAWAAFKEPGRLAWLKFTAAAVLTVAAGVAVAVGMRALDRRLQAMPDRGGPISYNLRLAERPEWMPSALVRRIAQSIVPPGVGFNDPALTEKLHAAASACPWISRVHQVSRYRTEDPNVGQVDIQAEYRRPHAVAGRDGNYRFIDAEGVVLPTDEVPRWQASVSTESGPRLVQYLRREDVPEGVQPTPIRLVIIDGVAAPPPPPGRQWEGPDVQEGLRLIRTIEGRQWASQIAFIDVSNHDCRLDRRRSQLLMHALDRDGDRTEIRFGRFALPGDYEIPTDVKLSHLDNYAAEHNGRLAGFNAYLDIRHERWLASVN